MSLQATETGAWTKAPPTEPGEYDTRRKPGATIYRVIVTRRGRGLSVYCPAFDDRVAMRKMEQDGIEWRRAEQ